MMMMLQYLIVHLNNFIVCQGNFVFKMYVLVKNIRLNLSGQKLDSSACTMHEELHCHTNKEFIREKKKNVYVAPNPTEQGCPTFLDRKAIFQATNLPRSTSYIHAPHAYTHTHAHKSICTRIHTCMHARTHAKMSNSHNGPYNERNIKMKYCRYKSL